MLLMTYKFRGVKFLQMGKIQICSVKGCQEVARKLSRCWNHYNEYQKDSTKKWQDRVKEESNIGDYVVTTYGRRSYLRYSDTRVSKSKDSSSQRIKQQTKQNKDIKAKLRLVRLELKEEWLDEENNYCIECGRWLSCNEACNYAHVIGVGECGGHEGLVLDKENQVPTCCECHTHMDNGVGQVRNEMKCWDKLEKIRAYLIKKHDLKGKIRDAN